MNVQKIRVAVIGAGQCSEQIFEQARELGRRLARLGVVLVCGGLSGVMEGACRGAVENGGMTVGILPGTDAAQANPYVQLTMATGLGHMRNYLVVLNSDIVVALEGGYGTLSEIGLALKIGRKVVAVGEWSTIPGVLPAKDVTEAVELMQVHLV